MIGSINNLELSFYRVKLSQLNVKDEMMKKFSMYLLVSFLLIISGCSQKEVEVQTGVDNKISESSSESILNSIPDTNISENDGNFSSGEKVDDGVYYIINGRKVFIQNVYFGFDKYILNAGEKDKAISNAEKLSELNVNSTVKVSGNTDEWGTDEYNYALGLKRAKAVKDILVQNGVKANISLVSFGESNPACTTKTNRCWQKNRRVEHELVK